MVNFNNANLQLCFHQPTTSFLILNFVSINCEIYTQKHLKKLIQIKSEAT